MSDDPRQARREELRGQLRAIRLRFDYPGSVHNLIFDLEHRHGAEHEAVREYRSLIEELEELDERGRR